MRIGLISDTHLLDHDPGLPTPISRAFTDVDLILHCGDLDSLVVLDWLEEIAEVRAIRGHTDPFEEGNRLADHTRVEEIEGIRIGMIHDLEYPGPGIPYRDGQLVIPNPGLDALLSRKFGQAVDIVVFGDTHEEVAQRHESVLFINPGSPTRPGLRHQKSIYGTVALLTITNGSANVDIIELEPLSVG